MLIHLESHEFTTRARPVAGSGVDLFWYGGEFGDGFYHVYRNGWEIGVTRDNHFWSQKNGVFEVFREVKEVR